MISVMNAVAQVVENSEFARKGLRSGLLNISAYAKDIHNEIERITKKEIKNDSSIVMALSRYGKELRLREPEREDLRIRNIISRSKLAEIAYTKTADVQERLATLNLLDAIRNAPFFVSTVGLTEVAIIVDTSLIDTVRSHFGIAQPLIQTDMLASLTLQVAIETIDQPGQSYRVLEQLASRNITVVEYTTSPTELNIILYEKDVSRAYQLLHNEFLRK
jgi:aspartokinase